MTKANMVGMDWEVFWWAAGAGFFGIMLVFCCIVLPLYLGDRK